MTSELIARFQDFQRRLRTDQPITEEDVKTIKEVSDYVSLILSGKQSEELRDIEKWKEEIDEKSESENE
jgi:hypothetical protein